MLAGEFLSQRWSGWGYESCLKHKEEWLDEGPIIIKPECKFVDESTVDALTIAPPTQVFTTDGTPST
jgi:hypothetical protein